MIRKEFSLVLNIGFLMVENNNKKAPWDNWFILVTDPSQTKP